jgi:hypothetical protein
VSGYEVVAGPYPFAPVQGRSLRREDGGAGSTVEALARVELSNYDLQGQLVYDGCDFERVFLARKEVELAIGPRADCILVFDADEHPIEEAGELGQGDAAGVLRPLQRYVLDAGIARATALDRDVVARLRGQERWGFQLVRADTTSGTVAVTPPILEQLQLSEGDPSTPSGVREFILCDGTHRIVDAVWQRGRPLAAVAVVGEPLVPYYAYARPPADWDATARNRLSAPPRPEDRYRVRAVDLAGLGAERGEAYRDVPRELHYRRYFRDLEKGFGPLGGQGGRDVS